MKNTLKTNENMYLSLDAIITEAVGRRVIWLNGNQSSAARSLKISRGTLRKYLKKYEENNKKIKGSLLEIIIFELQR